MTYLSSSKLCSLSTDSPPRGGFGVSPVTICRSVSLGGILDVNLYVILKAEYQGRQSEGEVVAWRKYSPLEALEEVSRGSVRRL